jgi:hypothetical protein
MNKEELRNMLISGIRKETPDDNRYGGQMCGLPSNKVILISEELNIRIEVGYHRSQIKNYEDAMLLMELYIDDKIEKLYPTKNEK